jgi:hypothetical protein
MRDATRRAVLLALPAAAAAAALLGMAARPAGADVVSPPGACVGTGTWQDAGFTETSTDHVPSDVITIPRSDTVAWAGGVGAVDAPAGEERSISGEIRLELPVGSVVIDDWDGDSENYSNAGDYKYDLPSALVGIEMRLSGVHREEGAEVCTGSVGLVVDGSVTSNPAAIGAAVLLVLSGAGLGLAAKGKPA